MKKYFKILLTLWCSINTYGQVDTVFKFVDTVITKNLELEKLIYKKVSNYFFINLSYAYDFDKNIYWCEGNTLVYDGIHFSSIRKNSQSMCVTLSYKVKKLIYSVGLQGYNFQRAQFSSDKSVLLSSSVSTLQLTANIGQKIKTKICAIIPSIGVGINLTSVGKSNYLTYDTSKFNNFGIYQTNRFYRNGAIYVLIGMDFQFFNSKKISPYLGFHFSKGISRESYASTGMRIHKFNLMPTVGLLYKF